VFVHTFADRKRFLCIYDYDTAVLVFVVDTGASTAPTTNEWPPDGSLRDSMTMFITNVVVRSQGLARLPTLTEVQEVSRDLAGLSPTQLKARSFPSGDLGLYRYYWPKDLLLKELKPDRNSAWPR